MIFVECPTVWLKWPHDNDTYIQWQFDMSSKVGSDYKAMYAFDGDTATNAATKVGLHPTQAHCM